MNLREATPADAASIRAIYAPSVEGGIASFELDLPSVGELGERIEQAPTWLVADAGDGDVLGYAYARAWRPRAAYQWAVEVSVYVARHAHRRGVGRRLLAALLLELRQLGFVTAFATIAHPNDASEALFAAAGFELVGVQRAVGYKLGAWHDVAIWQLVLVDPPLPATPPVRAAAAG